MKFYREFSILKTVQLFIFMYILFLTFPTTNSFSQSKFSCKQWMHLSDQTKFAILPIVMKMFTESENIEFKLTPSYYVSELDTLIKAYSDSDNEDAMNSSLGLTFRTIAVMDGDWNNGEKKLECAEKWLGKELFEEFKNRYPQKYQHLIELDQN